MIWWYGCFCSIRSIDFTKNLPIQSQDMPRILFSLQSFKSFPFFIDHLSPGNPWKIQLNLWSDERIILEIHAKYMNDYVSFFPGDWSSNYGKYLHSMLKQAKKKLFTLRNPVKVLISKLYTICSSCVYFFRVRLHNNDFVNVLLPCSFSFFLRRRAHILLFISEFFHGAHIY